MSSDTPISNGPNGDDGRDARGRFTVGNLGGPGNPRARQARQLRDRLDEALFKTCSPDRLLAMLDALMKRAETGDIPATKLLFDQIRGPLGNRILQQIEEVELDLALLQGIDDETH